MKMGACKCGTKLTFEGERWPGEVHVLVGTLDDPGARFAAEYQRVTAAVRTAFDEVVR